MTFNLKACAIAEKHPHPSIPERVLGAVRVTLSEHLDRDYDVDLVIKVWADSPAGEDTALVDRALLAKAAHILNRTLPHAEIAWADGAIRRVNPPRS